MKKKKHKRKKDKKNILCYLLKIHRKFENAKI